jgi:putative metallohydrolase (TIGR04338 family)
MRDSQRQRAYDAEKQFVIALGAGRAFHTLDEIQAYLFNLMQSIWFQKTFAFKKSVTVKLGRSNGQSRGNPSGAITIANRKNNMNEELVLHELAHVLAGDADGWHGRTWCMTFLQLIRKKFGPEAEDKMKECFTAQGVKFRPKRRVTTAKGTMPAGFAALQKWREEQKAGKAA